MERRSWDRWPTRTDANWFRTCRVRLKHWPNSQPQPTSVLNTGPTCSHSPPIGINSGATTKPRPRVTNGSLS
jgi:hypothetical protein